MAWEQLGWAALLLPTVPHASWCASSSSCGNQSRSSLHISHLPALYISHLPLPLDNALLMAEAGPRLKSISNSAYVTSANIIGQSKFVHPWPKSMDRKKLHLLWRSRRDCKVPWKGCVMVQTFVSAFLKFICRSPHSQCNGIEIQTFGRKLDLMRS